MLCACESSIDGTTASVEPCSLSPEQSSNEILQSALALNPFGLAPLSASLGLDTGTAATVRLTVKGKNGVASDAVLGNTECKKKRSLPVLGLYAGETNEIAVELLNAGVVSASP